MWLHVRLSGLFGIRGWPAGHTPVPPVLLFWGVVGAAEAQAMRLPMKDRQDLSLEVP